MPQWCLCLKPGGLLYHTDHITGFIHTTQPRSYVLAPRNTCFLENSFPQVVLSLLCWNNSKATQSNWGDFSVSGYGHLSSMPKLIPCSVVEPSSSTAPGEEFSPVLSWHLSSSHTLIQVFPKELSLALFPFLLPSIPWQSFTISSFQ